MRAIRLTFFYAGVVLATLAHAAMAAPARQCQDLSGVPIYRATGSYVTATLSICSDRGVSDMTPPPNNLRQGEGSFFVSGRYALRQDTAIVRAIPNIAYPVPPSELSKLNLEGSVAPPGVRMTNAVMALPFIPTVSTPVADLPDGRQVFGYSKLFMVPSIAGQARPLNENSVVIAVDGFDFTNWDGLVGYLNLNMDRRYVEVLYYQADEPGVLLRRAFLPLFNRAELTDDWNGLVQSHPLVQQTDRAGINLTKPMAVIGMAALFALAYRFIQTENGRTLYKNLTDPVCIGGPC